MIGRKETTGLPFQMSFAFKVSPFVGQAKIKDLTTKKAVQEINLNNLS
ncbi:hypothetical protein [Methanosarcina sp. KYL-1]|nr:hypothetical protein [Methanosarcina sp. KYL-1]